MIGIIGMDKNRRPKKGQRMHNPHEPKKKGRELVLLG